MMQNRKGFTLIELLVVIAIIGLLATLAVVSLNSARTKARDAKRKSDLNAIATAMELYNSQNGAYPVNGTTPCTAGANGIVGIAETAGIDTVCTNNTAIKDTTNTYLQAIPNGPNTGENYTYEGSSSTYCLGANLEEDTYFVCLNGSCFVRATDCTETGS